MEKNIMEKNILNSFCKSIVENKDFMSSEIIPGGSLNSLESLGVYQIGYRARLTDVLSDIYEACWSVLGDEEFFKLCDEYIDLIRSTSYNINQYGEHFKDLVKVHEDLPFLPILANFEWEFTKVFHSPSVKGFDFSLVTEIESKNFAFHKSFKLFSHEFSIFELWKDRKDLKDPSHYNLDQAEYLMLFNKDHLVRVINLKKEEHDLLKDLQNQKTLNELLYSYSPEVLEKVFKLIGEHELVVSVS